MTPFHPLLRNPHLATITANFWPRALNEGRFPVEAKLFPADPETRVLIHIQRPKLAAKGEVVLVHGLEGSSESGYMRSLAQTLLTAGFAVHRTNIRTCGGTEFLTPTVYHAGLTSDLFAYLMELDRQRRTPVYLAGFSLGGNIVLKLAGELGEAGHRILAGVCAVSTPIDLKACSVALARRANFLYAQVFLRSMRRRMMLRRPILFEKIPFDAAMAAKSIFEIDDLVTAPSFGFGSAEHYYQTQSAQNFLKQIRVPTLLVQAMDDPLVPFEAFSQPSIARNPRIELLAPEHGGHVGFVSRTRPRFWAEAAIAAWLGERESGKSRNI